MNNWRGLINVLKPIGASLLIAILIKKLTYNNRINCGALEAFIGGSSTIKDFFIFIALSIIWLIGALFYIFLLRSKVNSIVFFSSLTIIPFYPLIEKAINREPENNRT